MFLVAQTQKENGEVCTGQCSHVEHHLPPQVAHVLLAGVGNSQSQHSAANTLHCYCEGFLRGLDIAL